MKNDVQYDIKPLKFINTPFWFIASLVIVVSLYEETLFGPAIFASVVLISFFHFRALTPLIAFPTFIGLNSEFMHRFFYVGNISIPWKVPLLLCIIIYVVNHILRKKPLVNFAISPYFYIGWLTYIIFVSFKTGSFSFPLCVFISLLFGLSLASQIFVNETKDNSRFLLILFFFSILFMMAVGYLEIATERTFLLSKWAQEERYRFGIMRMGSTVADSNFLCATLISSLFIFNTTPFKTILTPVKSACINILIVSQIILTYSRTGLLILVSGLLFVLLLRSKHSKIMLAVTLPIAVFAANTVLSQLLNVDTDSNAARFYVNNLAFRLFLDNPIFGIGLGNFTQFSADTTDSVVGALETMNSYLALLTSGGLISLFFYLGYIWVIFSKSKRLLPSDRSLFLIGFFSYNVFIFTIDSFYIYLTWIFPSILLALIAITPKTSPMDNIKSDLSLQHNT